MQCACACYEHAIQPDIHEEKLVIARKSHFCCECGDEIKKGEKYQLVKGLWDGEWATYKTCFICMRIREDFCDTFAYTCLAESIWECLGFDYITGETDED